MASILIVDDEKDLLDLLKYNLEVSGYEVMEAETGRDGLYLAEKNSPDLIVLDVMLPDLLGFEILRRLRAKEKTRDVPIIMLTARGEESDVLVGFELGASDYVTKPFSPRELVARVRAVLGRSSNSAAKRITFGPLEIDLESQQVFVSGEEVVLAPQEYKLLAFLAAHPRRVYSRESLLVHAWEKDAYVEARTVDVHIRRLRTRIETDNNGPKFIETVRGSGYRFNPDPKKK